MTKADDVTIRRDVACPFCGLLCDDLSIERGRIGALQVTAAGCPISRAAYARQQVSDAPRIGGTTATLDQAVARAADILHQSRLPLFAGLGTDVAGMRAVMRLADRLGGVVDHMASDGLIRNMRVLQDSGWMTTTLSEIRNHMDVMLIVGPDPAQHFPRFLERCLSGETLYQSPAPDRHVFRLGPAGDGEASTRSAAVSEIACELTHLPAAVNALRCLVGGQDLKESAGLPISHLGAIADTLKTARYGVVVWLASAFEFSGGDLIIQSLADMVRDLNRSTRCAGLPLTGSDNLLGVNQVCTWQSGVPLRVSFTSGAPRHDPVLNSAIRLIGSDEADALMWISAFRDAAPPAAHAIPTIALTLPGTKFAVEPEVFIPVGTPGLDHAGQVFRTDAVVALPVPKLRDSALPGVADVLRAIDRSLPAMERRP